MGCTHSSSNRSDINPTSAHTAAASQTSRVHPRTYQPASSSQSSTSILPVNSRSVNAPLAFPRGWNSSSRTWTLSKLASERAAFFDTRVSGNAQIWAAISLAVSMARDEGDLSGAQAILEASGCVVPTGYLTDGIWDETGVLYKLPRWVVSNPVNLAPEHRDDEIATSIYQGDDAGLFDEQRYGAAQDVKSSEESNTREDSTKAATQPDKGKTTAITLETAEVKTHRVRLKLRLSDRGTDLTLSISPGDVQVKDIIMMARAAANISPDTRVNLAFMGQILEDDCLLSSQGWKENCVVNCLVFT